MRQLDCLTAKILLAFIGAQIRVPNRLPLTYIVVAA